MPDGIAEDLVRSGFRRWSALEDEKQRIADDLKELAAEWKANGLNTKAMRAAFRRQRKMDEAADEVQQEEAEVELYLACLRVGTPRATRAGRAEEPAEVRVQLTNGEKTVDIDPELLSTLVDASKSAAGTAIVMAAIETVKAPPPKAPDVEPEMPAFLVRTKPTAPAVPA